MLETLGELGHDPQMLVELHEAVEDQLMRCFCDASSVPMRGSRLFGPARQADDDDVRDRAAGRPQAAAASASAASSDGQRAGARHATASFLSSASSVSASSGVMRSTSSAASRSRS